MSENKGGNERPCVWNSVGACWRPPRAFNAAPSCKLIAEGCAAPERPHGRHRLLHGRHDRLHGQRRLRVGCYLQNNVPVPVSLGIPFYTDVLDAIDDAMDFM